MDELLTYLGGAECRSRRRIFSRIGWAMALLMSLQLVTQMAGLALARLYSPALLESNLFLWVLGGFSSYALAFPAAALLLKSLPTPPVPSQPLNPKQLPGAYFLCLGVMYLANIVSLALVDWVGSLTGQVLLNPVAEMMSAPMWLNLLLSCVLAPAAEEMLFRGVLLNRLRPYGERFALLSSALLFSLLHGNLFQIPYAFAVGLCFGYIALKTGQVRWTILLHALVNFVSMGLIPLLSFFGTPGELLLTVFFFFSMGYAVWAAATRWREISLSPAPVPTGAGEQWGLFLVNPGMTVFCFGIVFLVWFSVAL